MTVLKFSPRCLRAAWHAEHANLKDTEKEIQVLYNMAAQNINFLWVAKSKAGEMNYTWFSDGNVVFRKQPGTRVMTCLAARP